MCSTSIEVGVGRLVRAARSGHDYLYGYSSSGGGGVNPAAGRNANRTGLIDNGTVVATSCYDNADRLTSTTQSGYSTVIVYDAHGNTTTLAGETHTYDQTDRHLRTEKPGVRRVT